MLFEFTQPVVVGYFQCNLATRRPPVEPQRQGALLYVTSGEGTWTVGDWTFPVRRGDMIAKRGAI